MVINMRVVTSVTENHIPNPDDGANSEYENPDSGPYGDRLLTIEVTPLFPEQKHCPD